MPRSRRTELLRRAVLALTAAGLLASPTVATGQAAPPGPAQNEAPDAAAEVLAPPSPDLPGLPTLSRDLVGIPVDSAELREARKAYQDRDAALAGDQARRVEIDRALTVLAARRPRLEAELAGARARAAGLRPRLDEVTAAVRDLGVQLFVTGGAVPRLDAALTAEHPSVNDHDRRHLLGSATLDVLLTERAAYQARIDAALAQADTARAEIDAVDARADALEAQRLGATRDEAEGAALVAVERATYEQARVLAEVVGVEFPLVALDAYHRAATAMLDEQPGCGVRWWAIAGISRVEGRHGSYGGARLDQDGDASRPIIGIPLDGSNSTRVVADTDGGDLDGDADFDRAVGPMQFIPATWAQYAADGNGDGEASPFNLYDATLAAARYLCRASHDLEADEGLRTAFLAYNHSNAYVDTVLGYARHYEGAVEVPARPDPTAD